MIGGLVILCVVILTILACILPRSIPFDWRLHCVEITSEGDVIHEGEMVLTGKKQDYLLPSRRDELRFEAIQLPGLEISQEHLAQAPLFDEDLSFDFVSMHVYLPQSNALASFTLVMDKNASWFVVQCGGHRYAASFHDDFDPAALLEAYSSLLH